MIEPSFARTTTIIDVLEMSSSIQIDDRLEDCDVPGITYSNMHAR
jgi:hypothetical protein